ncbi:hypothetical protein C8R45DRAFT_1089248 [Mycena sanguinolenta]|nr:hypothetical protein C8R45DRAFT_1089248 [Mycena sanguinolenta]
MLCPSTPSVQPSTDELASYHAFPVSTRLSHPLLAVTSSVVALPCSPSSTCSPRRRTYLPANPDKGICCRRLGLDTTAHTCEIPPYSFAVPGFCTSPPPSLRPLNRARVRVRQIQRPWPRRVSPAECSAHSRVACARATTTHARPHGALTPSVCVAPRGRKASERLATSHQVQNRCGCSSPSSGAPGQSPNAHIDSTYFAPTPHICSRSHATSDSPLPRLASPHPLPSDFATSPPARTRVGTSFFWRTTLDLGAQDPIRSTLYSRQGLDQVSGFRFDSARYKGIDSRECGWITIP